MYCAREEKITIVEGIPYNSFKEKIKIQKELRKNNKKFSDLGGILFIYNREVAI
ncbi:hypothetical protein [Clostridium botulinum]|uniref:hypothetical protein n=1 Tax=Clostridium botulinum TaxID=1491 RepID=UPI001E2E9621|nr:hypothetical protein [Clostridium botulinum]MCD3223963.1 hypothetical protein [Clostridium botulinum C/D]MCD3298232.1 hypothetical protein [Clostridium botulinum C/D]